MSGSGESLREMVLFNIGDITCGIDIRSVREIKRTSGITRVYGMTDDVAGVLNLRGQIVTVLDLKLRFGFEQTEKTGEERIIIVPFEDEVVGVLVDSVEDAIDVDQMAFLPVPPNLDPAIGHYFHSVYQWENRIVSLVNLGELVAVIPSAEHRMGV